MMQEPLVMAVGEFVGKGLQGKLPDDAAPYLCGARLIPLRKPGAKMAVRPIAVGETLRRLVGKFAMRCEEVRGAVEALIPKQVGVNSILNCQTFIGCDKCRSLCQTFVKKC